MSDDIEEKVKNTVDQFLAKKRAKTASERSDYENALLYRRDLG
jgi:hypothetical protein